jgi:hypothetical protein
MKVIGAGVPRTATLSQKFALEILGFPCYHMVNVLRDMSQVPLWNAAADGNPDWEAIFADYEATVDWPGGYFYQELLEAYPDAKVLLSVRDPEAWTRSMRETVWDTLHGISLQAHLSEARCWVDKEWRDYIALMHRLLWQGEGTFAAFTHHDQQGLIDGFERHTEAVRSNVPADKLLIWQASDGWEPLCEFLEVPVPDQPFPRVNDSATYIDRIVDNSLDVLQSWRTERNTLAAV